MALLRRLVEDSRAVIVLSSAWRRDHRGRQVVSAMLHQHGIPNFIARTAVSGGARRLEIRRWLAANCHRVAAWVVLDDLPLTSTLPHTGGRGARQDTDFAAHFVQTDPRVGLKPKDIARGKQILEQAVATTSWRRPGASKY